MHSATYEQLENLGREQRRSARTANASGHHSDPMSWIQEADDEVVQNAIFLVFSASIEEWIDDPTTFASFWVQLIRRPASRGIPIRSSDLVTIEEIYSLLASHPTLQVLLLRALVRAKKFSVGSKIDSMQSTSSIDHLQLVVQLLTRSPTLPTRQLVEVFGDLMRLPTEQLRQLFPELVPAFLQKELTCFILDLANFASRRHGIHPHPAASQQPQLAILLAEVSQRLAQLSESPPDSLAETTRRGQIVTEGIALGVSLCDALALIGDPSAIPSLNQAALVEHRRLHVEAIAALARLGDATGKDILPKLAKVPSERLRVLAYAEELDLLDQVAPEHADSLARAEATFVLYLAQPTLFGLAPHHVECVAQREWIWPGCDGAQPCYLFQFVYQFPQGDYSNIGISGPVTHSVTADLTHVGHDDIFAIFAGWDVEHSDIYAVTADKISSGSDHADLRRLLAHLADETMFHDCVPQLLGHVVDLRVLIVSCRRDGQIGSVVVADDICRWFPLVNAQAPLAPLDLFHWFAGKVVLEMLNGQENRPEAEDLP